MFEDEISEPITQRITMTMLSEDGSSVSVSANYDSEATWREVSKQYHQFLSGLGYVLQSEDVGVDWDI